MRSSVDVVSAAPALHDRLLPGGIQSHRRHDRRERRRDRRVVAAGVRERLARQIEAELARRAAGAIELREHRAVIRRCDDDEHVLEILGRGAHQARAADVDLLDQIASNGVSAVRTRLSRTDTG